MKASPISPHVLFHAVVQYEIPAFQRRYVWKLEEQWEPLWNDVEDLTRSVMEDGGPQKHFMGAVVHQQMPVPSGMLGRRTVVDGQQRLTTLQLLLDAIQEVLEDQGYSDPAKRLSALVKNEESYLAGKQDRAFKVWPTTVDRDAFRHAMKNEMSATKFAETQIVQAHDYFKRRTKQWLEEFDADKEKRARAACALEQAVSHQLELVVIDLDESDNPHIIFEILNARGTPLLQSDMVKNQVFAKLGIGDDEREATHEMKEIWPFDQDDWWAEEVGRGLQRRPRVDVYLNHWLTLRNQAEMKPFDEFREFGKYSADKEIRDVVRDLGDVGKIFRDQIEEGHRTDIAKFLERRNVMNVGVVTPLLLWLLSVNLTPKRIANCLKAIESFLVRRMLCSYSARSYGELFVGLIRKLSEASTDDADSVVVGYLGQQKAQASLWPGDDELRERFVTAPLYQYLTRGRLRMVLEGIEAAMRTDKAESREVTKKLQIEHVMPIAWRANWPLTGELSDDEEAEAIRDRVIHTIGNLTLVNDRLNASLSNAPWSSKRKTLANHSVLFLNKRLVNEGPEVWDEAAIEKRAKWLHQQAVSIWPHADHIVLD
ncbi:MAG: DUF262 domain-containing protein [Gammaproteobacteria bacterium]|nr:DUF262 domain-containing protein [Gammaproteobacteria bacterium]MCY4340037.1 DUF262 domain-containing protein [Gammaproteobacteria bacterium]